eukprot:GDKJ01015405.1.p2 GENE.GDKJ01015405.1~~GDKJ01015405.1.p2  ORF type:complete len:266 (-),score=10.21 GDKJ01015405.1:413-1210(-)
MRASSTISSSLLAETSCATAVRTSFSFLLASCNLTAADVAAVAFEVIGRVRGRKWGKKGASRKTVSSVKGLLLGIAGLGGLPWLMLVGSWLPMERLPTVTSLGNNGATTPASVEKGLIAVNVEVKRSSAFPGTVNCQDASLLSMLAIFFNLSCVVFSRVDHVGAVDPTIDSSPPGLETNSRRAIISEVGSRLVSGCFTVCFADNWFDGFCRFGISSRSFAVLVDALALRPCENCDTANAGITSESRSFADGVTTFHQMLSSTTSA